MKIHTLNARDNIIFQLISDYFNLNSVQIFSEISGMFNGFNEILISKKIKYEKLKYALIPRREDDKKEILLIFDSQKIENCWYGYHIFKQIIKLLDKKSVNSFLAGDYIDTINDQCFLKKILISNLNRKQNIIHSYKHSSQYYLVFINNVSKKVCTDFKNGLENFDSFVDIIDVTYTSFLKTYISTILPSIFVKCGSTIIMEHPDDVPNNENENTIGYPFEENGFEIKSLQSSYYDIFLSYKIQRQTLDYNFIDDDIKFSINAISQDIKKNGEFNIIVESKKLEYLNNNKNGIMKRLNFLNIKPDKMKSLIKEKLSNNHIFNLEINQKTCKFNVLLEFDNPNNTNFNNYKVLAALEYNARNSTLRLITLY